MSFRNSSYGGDTRYPARSDIVKQIRQSKKVRKGPYSPGKGAIFAFVFAMMLWWIPIAGPAIAGYISGRKSGSSVSALESSLITAAVMVFLMFLLTPIKTGVLGMLGGYLTSGISALAQSPLTASSSIFTDLYVGYGLIKTVALIVPSSLITLVIFSYVGGTYSQFKSQENLLVDTNMNRSRAVVYTKSKNSVPVRVRSTGIKPWVSVEDNGEEDGYDITSLD